MLTNSGSPKNSTAFMGCVGADANGEKLEACAASDGVLAHYLKDTEQSTGTCAVLVKDGERSLIANLAAANHFKPSHLDTPLAKSIVCIQILLHCRILPYSICRKSRKSSKAIRSIQQSICYEF